MTTLVDRHQKIANTPWGIRKLTGFDLSRLRLFFLSLLWRAAVSRRFEFSEIELPDDHLETLREMIVSGNTNPISFYPIQLTQISTLGTIHNQSPFRDTKIIPSFEDRSEKHIEIFRFYFDGLIAHFHIDADESDAHSLGSLVVGADENLVISTVPYDISFQAENLLFVMAETYLR